ncbi:hypothetical protein CDD83_5851 [Cordyceps sp. RAO-2017]|nr:hypothetical protein CDD83_5851 [Cordyceps sp. RAO-2017]
MPSTPMWMVIDAIYHPNKSQTLAMALKTARNDGPWAIVQGQGDWETDLYRITACFIDNTALTATVGMHRSWEGLEPRMPHGGSNVTEASRRQLGASLTLEGFASRGVLVLDSRSRQQSIDDISTDEFLFNFITARLPGRAQDKLWKDEHSMELSAREALLVSKNAHPYYGELFQDNLSATQSPALATQAIFTRFCQMFYYGVLGRTSNETNAEASFASTALMPTRWTGFTIATILIGTHLLILLATTVLYLHLTIGSLVGNCWQAISQIISEDTLPILEQAHGMTDNDVRRWAQGQSLDVQRLHALQHRPDGRTSLVSVEEKRD